MAKRILVICGDQYHPAGDVMSGLQTLGEGDLAFERASIQPLTELEQDYDALVLAKLNVTSEEDKTPWVTPESDQLIGKRVSGGMGLLVIHAGTVGYGSSHNIRKMTGGSFIRHPEACEVTLQPTPESGLAACAFHDEHYFMETDSDNEVFLHAHSDHGVQPAGWLREHEKGKICILTPGHFGVVWENTKFQELVRYGLRSVIGE